MLKAWAGVPSTAAVARAADRAKVNCGRGDALWLASAWLRKVDGVPFRLCGAGRLLVRKKPALPVSWLSTCRPAARTALTNGASPPENTTRHLSGAVIAGSIGRTERSGPTSPGMVEWKTATYRVTPPSTTSSQTMSAASSPVCGRPSRGFLILIASAGRSTSFAVTTPVSGQVTGTSGLGGVVLDDAKVGAVATMVNFLVMARSLLAAGRTGTDHCRCLLP